jgi:hypothetical protein
MSINLEDYQELLDSLSPELQDSLRASWHEASKIFSARGLSNYLTGAAALKNLGKGDSLIASWIDHAPMVAKEIGEDAVPDLVQAHELVKTRLRDRVVLSTAPTANRLGEEALFKYLQFLNTLLSQAPRGVRPMLENLEMLFSQLTLGGLRRWALWGAHAHRTDYPEQAAYFSLQSKESLAMLQKERKGTLFIDVQRRINMYLRALWARDFFMSHLRRLQRGLYREGSSTCGSRDRDETKRRRRNVRAARTARRILFTRAPRFQPSRSTRGRWR